MNCSGLGKLRVVIETVPNLTFAHDFFGPCMKMPYNYFHAGPHICWGPNEIRDHFSCSQTQELCFLVMPYPSVMRVGSDTFGDPHFSKGLTKLAILPDYKGPGMLCLALPARSKVRKLDFQSEFSKSKIIRNFLNFFFIEEYQFRGIVVVIDIF